MMGDGEQGGRGGDSREELSSAGQLLLTLTDLLRGGVVCLKHNVTFTLVVQYTCWYVCCYVPGFTLSYRESVIVEVGVSCTVEGSSLFNHSCLVDRGNHALWTRTLLSGTVVVREV